MKKWIMVVMAMVMVLLASAAMADPYTVEDINTDEHVVDHFKLVHVYDYYDSVENTDYVNLECIVVVDSRNEYWVYYNVENWWGFQYIESGKGKFVDEIEVDTECRWNTHNSMNKFYLEHDEEHWKDYSWIDMM